MRLPHAQARAQERPQKKEQGDDARNKTHKKKSKKYMKDNQQTNLKVPSHFTLRHTAHARALGFGERREAPLFSLHSCSYREIFGDVALRNSGIKKESQIRRGAEIKKK